MGVDQVESVGFTLSIAALGYNTLFIQYIIYNLGLDNSGTGGLLERNSFSINITFTKMKIKT